MKRCARRSQHVLSFRSFQAICSTHSCVHSDNNDRLILGVSNRKFKHESTFQQAAILEEILFGEGR